MVLSNQYWSLRSLFFGFMDGLLILSGVFIGANIRFWWNDSYIVSTEYLALKMMLIVSVVQIVFYYLDLYDFKNLRKKKKIGILILESLGISSILIAVIYYAVPLLAIGRGIFAISLFFIFISTFFWRLLYIWVIKAWAFKERILIIGSGKLAGKIKSEILENGYDGFEIIGFIDERGKKDGNRL
jgi:FlaA1/EpsC-like NDP-sugar epimerase